MQFFRQPLKSIAGNSSLIPILNDLHQAYLITQILVKRFFCGVFFKIEYLDWQNHISPSYKIIGLSPIEVCWSISALAVNELMV